MQHPAEAGEREINRLQPTEQHEGVSSRMFEDAHANLAEVQKLSQQAHVNPSGETADMLNGFELTALHENNPAQGAQSAPLDSLASPENIGPAGQPGPPPESIGPAGQPGPPPETQGQIPQYEPAPSQQPPMEGQYLVNPYQMLAPETQLEQPPIAAPGQFNPYEPFAPQNEAPQAPGEYPQMAMQPGDPYPPYPGAMDGQVPQTPWNTQIYNPFQAMMQVEQGLLGGPGTDGPMGILAPDGGDQAPDYGSYDAPPAASDPGDYNSDQSGGDDQ
jgi:hypothetical protein